MPDVSTTFAGRLTNALNPTVGSNLIERWGPILVVIVTLLLDFATRIGIQPAPLPPDVTLIETALATLYVAHHSSP